MVQKVAVKHKFEAGLRHAPTGKFYHPGSKWVPFSKFGNDKAAKGEEWASPFISCAEDTVGL